MTVKMKRLVPIICITAALLAAGCGEKPEGGGGSKGPEELTNLKITASVSTWGTESPLERDDRVGLYASAPFNVDNLMLTVGDAMSLIPSRDLIWQADSTVSSVTFVAYAPYSASYSGRYVTFSARQDQTSESGVKASDLMMAKADVSFSEPVVRAQDGALSPISSGAAKYTYQNGGLSSETPICWNAGQKEATRFLLMYPYNEKIRDIDGRSSFEFCVNADQSTHAKYTASDLMYADTVATPDDPVVFFSVRHALSQVVINLENKSDKKVTDAYFSNVYGNVEFSYATGIQTTGSMGTIRAYSLNASSGQS